MGNGDSKPATAKDMNKAIPDLYKTYAQLKAAIRSVGIESMQMIIGIDFSKSNTWTGERSYQRSLHDTSQATPYEKVMRIMDSIASDFDDDNIYPVYRFGCMDSKDTRVLPLLYPKNEDPHFAGINSVAAAYREALSFVQLSGPTTFAPLIQQAIAVSKAYNNKQYVLLLILTDGDVSDIKRDTQAIVDASQYPISISAVGLGDGPFKTMEHFDDNIKGRRFDNFQFVNFTALEAKIKNAENPELILAKALFQEIPSQYKFIRQLGYL